MRAKGFPVFVTTVIITAGVGCDNVSFEGFQMELLPPSAGEPVEREEVDTEDPVLEPLDLGTVVYLVQPLEGARATALPVVQLRDGEYRPLPDPAEVPDLVERFGVGHWSEGLELVLVAQGARVGTFIASGVLDADHSTCRLRPRGEGYLELHPGAGSEPWFLGVEKTASEAPLLTSPFPGLTENAALRAASVEVTQRLIPELAVPWPPSIPGIRRDLRPFALGAAGGEAFAASFVYDDDLTVGPAPALAYSLFLVAAAGPTRYEPVFTWYQRVDAGGKAFPRFMGAHALREPGAHDVLLEVFGEEGRWFTVLGNDNGGWAPLFADACGFSPDAGAFRSYP